MIVLRSAVETDLEGICRLAKYSGITTLPDDPELLTQRLQKSCESFKAKVCKPTDEYYLFVLEDLTNSQIIGTSAIEAKIGQHAPFYSYRLEQLTQVCQSLNLRNDYTLLHVTLENQNKSELCTLFLEPNARHHGNGLLLSRARFLFIAQCPERFATSIIAEMRGVADEVEQSPFWKEVGQHFFPMPFTTADRLTMTTNKQFITELLPKSPIYVNLLPDSAQNVIGQANQYSVPAMKILLAEGFLPNNTVDIFDAGPTVEAQRDKIKTITQSRVITLDKFSDTLKPEPTIRCFLANTSLNFRATSGKITLSECQKKGIINQQTAEILKLKPGDRLRVSPL